MKNSPELSRGPTQRCALVRIAVAGLVGWAIVCGNCPAQPAPADLFSLPLLSIASFLQQAGTLPPDALVKVQGTVTLHHSAGAIFIQDQTGSLFAEAQTNSSVVPGDVVEVVGKVSRSGYSPTLHDCVYRRTGERKTLIPKSVTGTQLRTGAFDMQLVRLRGRLVADPIYRGDMQVLHINADDLVVNLELRGVGETPLSQLHAGTVLRAVGVCSIGADGRRQPTSVRVHLRSGSDVLVLEGPPWWTPARMALGLGVALVGFLAALVWVATLRHKVQRKTEQIAQRLRREATLEDRYRRIVDTALEGILLLDREGRITFLNRFMADMLGYPPNEMTGRSFTDFMHPKDRSAAQEYFVRAASQVRSLPRDMLLQHRDGSDLWSLVATNSFLDEQGLSAGTLAMVTNISERKVAEQRIQHLNEVLEKRVQERTTELVLANGEMESFSYSVSHDLRAPLRAIGGFAEALNEDYGESLEEEARQHLDRIRAASQHMNRLIDGLLSLARVSRNEIKRETVDLSEIATAVVEEIRQSQPSVRAQLSIQPGLVDRADRNLVRIVLSNLFQNACKFSSKVVEPRVEMGKIVHGRCSAYFVRDNGAGFNPAQSEKLFKVFQRLHSAAEYEGSGIGLATVQKIVHRHGGKVWAEGKPEQGACFYFTLHPDNAAPRSAEGWD